jgi:hypothetical protein
MQRPCTARGTAWTARTPCAAARAAKPRGGGDLGRGPGALLALGVREVGCALVGDGRDREAAAALLQQQRRPVDGQQLAYLVGQGVQHVRDAVLGDERPRDVRERRCHPTVVDHVTSTHAMGEPAGAGRPSP